MVEESKLPSRSASNSLQRVNITINTTSKLLAESIEQKLTVESVFEDHILRLPYGINEQYFVTGKHNGIVSGESFFPYLLPIKRRYFDFFEIKDLQDQLSFEINGSKATEYVVVQLNLNTARGQIKLKKTYRTFPDSHRAPDCEDGIIIVCNVGIGFFPLYKVLKQPHYNDFYKVMLVDVDDTPALIEEDYDLKFYADNLEITNNLKKNSRRTKREARVGSSNYYELAQAFDFIEVFPQSINNKEIRGLLIPKWRQVSLGSRPFSFAVDFNSSFTHIAYNDNIDKNPKPFTIGEEDIQVIMLNKPIIADTEEKHNTASRYSSGLIVLREAKILQEREFIPSIIGKEFGSNFFFPIKTAVCETSHFEEELCVLFGNINIAYSFEKERFDPKAPIKTNLFCNKNLSNTDKSRIEAFLKQILLHIKYKTILNDGDPGKLKLTYTYPLHLDESKKKFLNTTWANLFAEVFKDKGTLNSIPEPAAAYYLLRGQGSIKTNENVVSLFIGERTTDVLFFNEDTPVFSSSFSFGSNALWGEGSHELHNKTNGFLEAFKKTARTDAASTRRTVATGEFMEELYNDLIHYTFDGETGLNSSDIISFLFNYDEEALPQLKFGEFLRKDKHLKVILLLHYSAVIYHIGQILNYIKQYKDPATQIPRCLVISGSGCRYLIELVMAKGKGITLLTRYILQQVCGAQGLDVPMYFEVILSHKPKETTANGGVLAIQHEEYDIEPLVLAGLLNAADANRKLRYNQIDVGITNSIMQNIEKLLSLIFDQEEVDLKNDFGIDTDLDFVRKSILLHGRDGLQEGLNRHTEYQECSEDSPFFYPLIHSLFKLSKELSINHYT
jgi:hypothetical protein